MRPVLLPLLLLLGGCATTTPSAPAFHAADAAREIPADVDGFFRSYFAAVEAGDVDALLALFDSDFVVQWPSSPAISDRERLRAALVGLFQRVRQDVDWEVLEAGAAGPWAWARVREKATHTPVAGGERRVLEGVHLVILRRVDGRWRLHRDTGALDRPPSTAPES